MKMNPRVASLKFIPLMLLMCMSGLLPLGVYGSVGAPPPGGTITTTQPPVITDFRPKSGPVGTEVTVSGQNLAGAITFLFNGISATFQEGFQGTNVIATVPTGATTGRLSIYTDAGSFTTTDTFTVTAVPEPTISSISPTSGPQGTQVFIAGDNLESATTVRFNGVSAQFSVFGTGLSATVPAGANSGPVTVITPGGSDSSATPFTVTVTGAPVITDVTPLHGPPGTFVTIAGMNLETTTSVAFGGVPATFNVFGGSLFTLVPDAAVSGPIEVFNPKGTALSSSNFTVVSALSPQITGFVPNAGIPGATITVNGTNFVGLTDVRVGGVEANFAFVSSSVIQVTVPANPVSGPITVSTTQGTAVSDDTFYVPGAITGFDPGHGSVGSTVAIHGINLSGALQVGFAGVNATYTNLSSTEIRATVPAGATSGSISVATPAGFAISDADFYLPPIITRLDPPSGLPSSVVNITGTNLSGIVSVRFGTVNATFAPVSLNTLTAVVPAGAVSAPITVTTAGGTVNSPRPFYVGTFADVSVDMSASPDTVNPGDFLTYTVSVSNIGPQLATDVLVVETLPAGMQLLFLPSGVTCSQANNVITCQLGGIAAGGNVAFRLSGTVPTTPYLTNTVTVSSSAADPDLSNNNDSLITALGGNPPPVTGVDMQIAMSGSTIQVSWPSDANGFVLETAPALATPPQWTASSAVPVTINGRNIVAELVGPGKKFYRLHHP